MGTWWAAAALPVIRRCIVADDNDIHACSLPQALCFMAGANSIFDGDKLLTTPNNDRNEDLQARRGGGGLLNGPSWEGVFCPPSCLLTAN